ncbi:major facilitator superfamily transporter [Polystyrenella longa]|uniref:Major facilitator superfamily transporter n=1 Tax=Polystyrenella longa TaxID=2528007 RepID=A0A518CM76_9PLAN|nr:MFS transporter [Polystyrenella longa]QDU80327.1 major facilitator superfamily transporter [Polystyrenella longa]
MSSFSPIHTRPYTEPNIYNKVFWIAYFANVSVVSGNALTFRFAELVNFLGGTEEIAGQIISISVMAALAGRVVLGQIIDRFGIRVVWMSMSIVFTFGSLMIVSVQDLTWVIYLGRILFAIGLSGMVTSSMVHIQNQAPDHRRTEIIGSLGSSGFVGMILGSQLGDIVMSLFQNEAVQFHVMFAVPVVLGIIYLILVTILTRGEKPVSKESQVPFSFRLLWEQWPGWILLVSFTMGVCFTSISLFLTRYATELGLKGIGTYFTSYAISALIFRMASRDWSRTMGRHRMVLFGLAAHAVGYALLPLLTKEWHFVIPAIFSGFGHAILFPAVVSLGSGSFRKEWRGIGTNVILGGFDVGTVLSAPILGAVIVWGGAAGFEMMFYACSATAIATIVIYSLTAARIPDQDLLFGKTDITPVESEDFADKFPEKIEPALPVFSAERTAREKVGCGAE